MKLTVGNCINDHVTSIVSDPTRRQLRNALRRMDIRTTPSRTMIFRNVPVGNHNPTDEQVHEWDRQVRAS